MLLFGKKNNTEAEMTEEVKKPVEKPVIDESQIKTIPRRYYNVRGPVLVEGWKEVERRVKGQMPGAEAEKPSGKIILSEKERQKQAKIEKKKKEKEEKIRQKQLKKEQKKKSGKPSKAKLYITGIIVILIVAAVSVVIFYYFFQPSKQQPSVNQTVNANIAPEPVISIPVPTPEPEPVPVPTPEPEPADRAVFKDTDNDGLSDIEEEIYKSNIRNSDTDNDFYPDWLEVTNAYNPTGFAPQRILPTGLVRVYSSEGFGVSVYYPAPWDYQEVGLDVIFLSDIDETVKVTKNPNINNLTIDSIAPQSAHEIREEDNLIKYTNPIANIAYIQSIDKTGPIYIISLIKESAGKPNFKGTFLMMVKSFSIL